ncbi:AI-2E family transporter [Algoriphagus halophilus]|uniref:Predicted PurR-regulated permease PerM n=1 Tax=Algoriphagus halophilus TaxID=226505 RepID=A0A1N6DHE8_9BACT|nr:AI-2E family transporter [Algoriphagus halophilus]SIN70200.1 Predicted PurR-regulated permease PerM [Algoriphagus halophilus]
MTIVIFLGFDFVYLSSIKMKNENLQNIANLLIVLILGFILLKEGSFIIVPLVWGVFFAFALNPMSNWIEKKRIPRGLAILSSILVVSLLALSVFYLLLNQVIGLISDIPEIGSVFNTRVETYLADLQEFFGVELNSNELLDKVGLFDFGSLNKTIFATGKSIVLAGIIPLYIFLLMYYKDFFVEFLIRRSKDSNEKIINWAKDSGRVIQFYLAGMLKVTAIVALMSGVFFYLIGVKYFLLFAVFIALMNLIPYVGVFISSLFAILYVFLTTDSLAYPLITFFVLWGIQLIENNLITPLVVGSEVKVNALAVVLAILIGGWVWGISGMILFIPLVGVLKITLEKNENLKAYGFLLGDEITISEESENFWKLIKKNFRNSSKK